MTKRKSLFCTMLIVALMMAMCTPVFAAESDEEIGKYETGSVTIQFTRNSNTSARSITTANLMQTASSATGTLTLQEYRNGSWVVASGVSPVMQSKTFYDSSTVYMVNDWQLIKGKNYRLKLTCIDKTNGITYTKTSYSYSI